MKAVDIKFSGIFATTPRLEIPLFQRPYVWEEQKNWLPLWLDIRKATEQVEQEELGSTAFDEAPTYFLGAVVLQERASPLAAVRKTLRRSSRTSWSVRRSTSIRTIPRTNTESGRCRKIAQRSSGPCVPPPAQRPCPLRTME